MNNVVKVYTNIPIYNIADDIPLKAKTVTQRNDAYLADVLMEAPDLDQPMKIARICLTKKDKHNIARRLFGLDNVSLCISNFNYPPFEQAFGSWIEEQQRKREQENTHPNDTPLERRGLMATISLPWQTIADVGSNYDVIGAQKQAYENYIEQEVLNIFDTIRLAYNRKVNSEMISKIGGSTPGPESGIVIGGGM